MSSSNHKTYFSKFHDAIENLELQLKRMMATHRGDMSSAPRDIFDFFMITALALSALKTGQRFYLPEANRILLGRKVDEELKQLIRLPYDCVAILSECELYKNIDDKKSRVGTTWKISIAFSLHSALWKNFMGDAWRADTDGEYTIILLSLVHQGEDADPALRGISWWCSPAMVRAVYPALGEGYSLSAAPLDATQKWQEMQNLNHNIEKEFMSNAGAVNTLCVMLNLHNVKSRTVQPDEALQKKRRKLGHPPLFSYRVLVVDGEEWHDDGQRSGDGSGAGVRSHMRRGHIRRLHNSDRRVWVRATLVHGRADGYVTKDYQVGEIPAS